MFEHLKQETIPLHQTASGNRYEITVYRHQVPEAKRSIYLQAGLHGVELTGIPTLFEFMRRLPEYSCQDNLIIVPISNPMGLDSQIMGLQTGYNNIHTNQQNCLNWNRIGHLNGKSGMEAEWISTLLGLAAPADMIIDLHTAGVAAATHIYCHQSQVDVAQGCGLEHILAWGSATDSFSDTCFKRGQVALTLELGPSRMTSHQSVDKALNAVLRLMGIFPKVSESPVWDEGTQLRKWYCTQAGVLLWQVKAGDRVRKGQTLAHLYNHGGIHELASPFSGVLLLVNPIHAPQQGQELAKFLVDQPED